MGTLEVFGDSRSGNCHKVKYVCDHLRLAYAWHEVDVIAGAARRPPVAHLNPLGQVPVVVLADGRTLAQSNAIMSYLAEGSPLLPVDAYLRAKVFEYLFWEQYSHEPYIAVCRFQMVYLEKAADEREGWRVRRGDDALDFMQSRLEDRQWLVGDAMTIADIGLLAYTRLAHEGGFDLESRPAVRAWIRRCERELEGVTS